MTGPGFLEGLQGGRENLRANKADARSQKYLEMNQGQTQFSQDFKTKEEFRGRLQQMASGLAQLKSQATSPERLQALQKQADMVREAFMVEAEQLGMADQANILIERALSTPTLIEQSQIAGEAEAAGLNAQADNLSPERQIAAGVAPKPTVPKLNTSELNNEFPNQGLADNSTPLTVEMIKGVTEELIANGVDPKEAENMATQRVNQDIEKNTESTVFQSIKDASDPEEYLKTVYNKIPLLNRLAFFEDEQDAAQTIDLFNERVKKDLTGKANYSVKELEGILPLLPKRGLTSTDKGSFIKYKNLRKKLLGDLEEAKSLSNKQGLSRGAYSKAVGRVGGLQRVLEQLGDPDDYLKSKIPQGAVQKLKANPNLKSDFNKKFGEGAAEIFLGGK